LNFEALLGGLHMCYYT